MAHSHPRCPPVQEEDDDKDETYGESKKKAGGGRKKKSAKVSVTSAGKKKLPPTAQMLSELRAAEIDVEKKIAKEKEHLDKLENTLKTEPPVVASVLKEMRDKIVPKGMGAKAGIQAINKFIGALEVSVSGMPLDLCTRTTQNPSHFVHFSHSLCRCGQSTRSPRWCWRKPRRRWRCARRRTSPPRQRRRRRRASCLALWGRPTGNAVLTISMIVKVPFRVS
jgi:hypothetical protein